MTLPLWICAAVNIVSVSEAFERGRAISAVPRYVPGLWRLTGDINSVHFESRHDTARHSTISEKTKNRVRKIDAKCGRSDAEHTDRDRSYIKEKRRQCRTYGTTFRYLSGRTHIGGMQSLHCRSYRVVTCRLMQFWIMPLFTFAHYVTQPGDMLYTPRVYDITLARRKIILRLCYIPEIARVIVQRRLCALKSSRYFSHRLLIASVICTPALFSEDFLEVSWRYSFEIKRYAWIIIFYLSLITNKL